MTVLGKNITLGITLGAFMGVVFYVFEPVVLFRTAHSYFGTSMWELFVHYCASGMALGLVVAILSSPLAGRRLSLWQAGVLIACTIGFLFTSLFLVRKSAIAELLKFPVSTVITIGAAALAWLLIMVLLGRGRGRRDGWRRNWMHWSAVVSMVVVTTSGVIGSVVDGRLPTRAVKRDNLPNVVFVLVDALRHDRLGSYGYGRDTSPLVDRLGREGVVFNRTYSHGNKTIRAMPSLFTGMLPPHHGALGRRDLVIPLPESRVTITEMLRDAGYTTIGMLSNVFMKTPYNLNQGFDRVEEFNAVRYGLSLERGLSRLGVVEKPVNATGGAPDGAEVTDKAIEWLHRLDTERPFFMYLHYMDVHHVYSPPPEYVRRFSSSDEVLAVDAKMLNRKTMRLVQELMQHRLDDVELTRLSDLYDGCIRYTDDQIARFMAELEALQLDRETIFVFTSDHGDEFFEHGSLYHTNLLHEELIRVPLVLWRSGRSYQRRVNDMARHIDVLPTLAAMVGIDPPEQSMGRNLLPTIENGDPTGVEESFSMGDYNSCLNRDFWKILYVDSSGSYLLYNLEDDTLGRTEVSVRYPDVFEEMKARLDKYLIEAEQVEINDQKKVDPETMRQLKALGYM